MTSTTVVAVMILSIIVCLPVKVAGSVLATQMAMEATGVAPSSFLMRRPTVAFVPNATKARARMVWNLVDGYIMI